MAKRKESSQQEVEPQEESLVPMIEQEEHRLAEMLENARTEAAQRIERAEREAGQRVEETKQRMPEVQSAKRSRAMAEFEKEADVLRKEASEALAGLSATAEANKDAAVAKIVDAVWPVGR